MKLIASSSFLFLLIACSRNSLTVREFEVKGEPYAHFRIARQSFSPPFEKQTGYYFYKEDVGKPWGPTLTIYEFRNGTIVDERSTGTASRDVLNEIAAIDFSPFDYEGEIELAHDKYMQSEQQPYEVTLDGTEWEIMLQTENGPFSLRKWNPGSDFFNYSKFSTHLQKLEQVIRRLLMYYGETTIGVL